MPSHPPTTAPRQIKIIGFGLGAVDNPAGGFLSSVASSGKYTISPGLDADFFLAAAGVVSAAICDPGACLRGGCCELLQLVA